MVFSSEVFLGVFLPAVIVLYFIIRNRKWKNYILLLASLVFYAWGEPVWIVSMIAIVLLDYFGGLLLGAVKGGNGKRVVLALLVVFNLAQLFVFKYLNFIIDNVNGGFHTQMERFPFAMPIGISFFTFQALTYVVDVYREEVPPQKNFPYLLLYISMFPQLIAGPIVRYGDVSGQLMYRQESKEKFAQGCFRFTIGLSKKVILANYAGTVATGLLTDGINSLTASGAWVGILMYTFQIYFDFSGYSDMAIGLGKMFGFEFKENFNYPYIARSVTDFWRRWHISLSAFFRDYVYIPIGGNRKHQYLNIFIVWGLTGLWHGANWNFLIWGLYFALLLVLEKLLLQTGIDMGKIPFISNVLLLCAVMYSWAIFYYTDISQLKIFTCSLLGLGNTAVNMSLKERSVIYASFRLIPVMAAAATPIPAVVGRKMFGNGSFATFSKAVLTGALLALCYILILGQSYNPFLYFRF